MGHYYKMYLLCNHFYLNWIQMLCCIMLLSLDQTWSNSDYFYFYTKIISHQTFRSWLFTHGIFHTTTYSRCCIAIFSSIIIPLVSAMCLSNINIDGLHTHSLLSLELLRSLLSMILVCPCTVPLCRSKIAGRLHFILCNRVEWPPMSPPTTT